MRLIGIHAAEAHRLKALFRQHDEETVRTLSKTWGQNKKCYFSEIRRRMKMLDHIIQSDQQTLKENTDAAWDIETPRGSVTDSPLEF